MNVDIGANVVKWLLHSYHASDFIPSTAGFSLSGSGVDPPDEAGAGLT